MLGRVWSGQEERYEDWRRRRRRMKKVDWGNLVREVRGSRAHLSPKIIVRVCGILFNVVSRADIDEKPICRHA
jgi:hypothetical protein